MLKRGRKSTPSSEAVIIPFVLRHVSSHRFHRGRRLDSPGPPYLDKLHTRVVYLLVYQVGDLKCSKATLLTPVLEYLQRYARLWVDKLLYRGPAVNYDQYVEVTDNHPKVFLAGSKRCPSAFDPFAGNSRGDSLQFNSTLGDTSVTHVPGVDNSISRFKPTWLLGRRTGCLFVSAPFWSLTHLEGFEVSNVTNQFRDDTVAKGVFAHSVVLPPC